MSSVTECRQVVEDLIAVNPRFAALLSGENGQINADCRVCSDTGAEANKTSFMTINPDEVVLCVNYIKKADIKKELTFQATQAYDFFHQRTNFNTCEGIAYTKVRAVRDAYCSTQPFEWMTTMCIFTFAGVATKAVHPKSGDSCVSAVFDRAMADKHPILGVVDPLSKVNRGPAGHDY